MLREEIARKRERFLGIANKIISLEAAIEQEYAKMDNLIAKTALSGIQAAHGIEPPSQGELTLPKPNGSLAGRVLNLLSEAREPLRSRDIVETLHEVSHNVRSVLSSLKKRGVLVNPDRGFWTVKNFVHGETEPALS